MMRLLVLNDHYFGAALRRPGVEVLSVGPGHRMDIEFDPERDDLREMLQRAKFVPDAVLQVDSIDTRCFFKGIESFSVPTAFYAVDTPINEFWQLPYAQVFDRVYVDQFEVWKSWRRQGIEWARWLPLAAEMSLYHPPENEEKRDLPIVFVGTLDDGLRPKRTAILRRLQRIAEVTVIDGDGKRCEKAERVARLYRRARIVLNENLFDGINLRTFEAMASGAVVLTESGHGAEKLFEDGKQLALFGPDNLERVALELLGNPGLRKSISLNGVSLIRRKHLTVHRAAQVIHDLAVLRKDHSRNTVQRKITAAHAMWQASWKWPGRFSEKRKPLVKEILGADKNTDSFVRAELLEGVGMKQEAALTLCDVLDNNPQNTRAVAALAALLLMNDDLLSARKVLAAPDNAGKAELHAMVGRLLEGAGETITPGFNRSQSPVIGWSAFEHYQRALALDPDSLKALEGIDRILSGRNAEEFSVPLWERYCNNHPDDTNAAALLESRAVKGYLRTPLRVPGDEECASDMAESSSLTPPVEVMG